MGHHSLKFAIASFLAIVLTATLSAQVTNATLNGTVTDLTGSTVQGANVAATNLGTNLRHETTTDSAGAYTLPGLPPGDYRLEVQKTGFKQFVVSQITLQVAQEARVSAVLQIGQVDQTITVKSVAPLLNTDNAMIGGVISEKRIVDMPLNGRNFMQLTLLTGGINEGPSSNQSGSILSKGFAPSAAGAPAAENNYLLDGANNKELFFNTYNLAPSVDAIEEFRVQIGQYSAEFGGGGGAIINVITKSGTNQFHGAAWEFVRNSDFDARNYFLKPNQSITPLHQNQFGAAGGGPIIKNKTFFFGDIDITRISQGNLTTGNVPTDAQRGGDLSAFSTVIKDPITHAPFPGNIIPAGRISPISAALEKYYPQPTNSNPQQNFGDNLAARNNSKNYFVKITHNFTDTESLMGHYGSQSVDRTSHGTFPLVGGQIQPQRFQNAIVSLTSTFSPTFLNEGHFSYSRTINRTRGQNTGTPIAANAGIPNTPTSGLNSGFPETLSIGKSAISGLSEGQPWFLTVNTFEYADGITWIHGPHTIKAGADVSRIQADALIATHQNNQYTFSGQFTGDGFADFLLGDPSSALLALAPNQPGRFRATSQAYYVLDDWKVTPSFTMNVGLRYEYYSPAKELGGLTPIFDTSLGAGAGGLRFPEQNTTALPWYQANRPDLPVGKLNRSTQFTPDRNNVGPRFGFAWRPRKNEDTVIRGGYGWFYNAPTVINIVQNSQTGPPSQFWPTYSSAANTPTLNYGGQVGVPPDQALKSATFGLLTGPEAHNLNPYTQQWSFSIGRQIHQSYVFDLEYLGSKTTHQENLFDYNATTPGTTALATRVPYPRWGRVYGFSSGAAGNYNALMATAEGRLSHGLAFKVSYTFSKSLTYNGGAETAGFIGAVQNPLNLRAESGVSSNNMPQRFVATFTYDLPFGSGQAIGSSLRGVLNKVVSGWNLNGIVTAEDGMFFSPTIGTLNCNSAYQMTCRPNLLAKPLLGGSGAKTPRWAVKAFDWPNNTAVHPAEAPRFGSAGPNILQGNGLFDSDLSVRKEIPINERIRFEFRFESFNALNHTNFSNPTSSVDSVNFGRTFSAGSPRLNQFGLKMYW